MAVSFSVSFSFLSAVRASSPAFGVDPPDEVQMFGASQTPIVVASRSTTPFWSRQASLTRGSTASGGARVRSSTGV
jgi:hypothetical protein